MRVIALSVLRENPGRYAEVAEVLSQGGLVCFPAGSGYKIAVELGSEGAVTSVMQAKRRIKNAPALVFVPTAEAIEELASCVSEQARVLMRAFWPGPVTLLVEANEEIAPRIRKPLTQAKGWIGVRLPHEEVPMAVLQAFGKPILVSSANIASKRGAHSVAQVKKNFGRTVELLVDAGDIVPQPSSTLVDVSSDAVHVIRAEAVPEADILAALAFSRLDALVALP
ncbi:MAG: L-threonylcarbamoyladenylate synthase [Myxococcota bacterium]|jgi:L-threonylcarbamoyladenylate synthase|nr:L-threonylcarbamoyladenylate synthase [Myxococcota bacterium]